MRVRVGLALLVCAVAGSALVTAQRTTDRHRDLDGYWTNGTATPLERPSVFKDKPILTTTEAKEYEKAGVERLLQAIPEPDRSTSGDLSDIYLETGSLKLIDGRRTSLIVDPIDGRLPPQLPAAKERAANRKASRDDPEGYTLDERCLQGAAFGSSQVAAPIVPNPFGENYYQIVDTPQFVVIYTEIVHDARIIRIGGTHPPSSVQRWLGDSIGRWEGNTLVVDTTNFTSKTHSRGSGERMHVIERFTRTGPDRIAYRATIEDPDTWAQAWTMENPLRGFDQPVLEFACHEGNYSMANALRGQRAKDK
jgi:hypothetical protein